MVEVKTRKGETLIADKVHIDTYDETSFWMWFFGKDGNYIKENKGQNAICEIPESITINGVKFVKAE